MSSSRRIQIALTATSALIALGLAGQAAAQSTFDQTHPRRAEVNQRLANQNKRIKQEVAEGEIGKRRAAKLHAEDHKIRGEERTMASLDGGHITKADQRSLNQQENAVSRQIGK